MFGDIVQLLTKSNYSVAAVHLICLVALPAGFLHLLQPYDNVVFRGCEAAVVVCCIYASFFLMGHCADSMRVVRDAGSAMTRKSRNGRARFEALCKTLNIDPKYVTTNTNLNNTFFCVTRSSLSNKQIRLGYHQYWVEFYRSLCPFVTRSCLLFYPQATADVFGRLGVWPSSVYIVLCSCCQRFGVAPLVLPSIYHDQQHLQTLQSRTRKTRVSVTLNHYYNK